MWYVAVFFLGVIFGIVALGAAFSINLNRLINRHVETIGTLRIDRSDPDGPYMFLEIDSGKSHLIDTNEFVTMRVEHESYIPRE